MSMESTAYGTDASSLLTVVRKQQTETLRECVTDALQSYFANMGDHNVSNLYRMVLSEVECPLLEAVIEHTDGNQTKAAAVLGISRSTLRKKLSQYNLE